jgi:hypothetical protein
LLGVASLREGADEDALDALDLSIARARLGITLLAGGSIDALDGPPCIEPTVEDVARLMQGRLDGLAAADVAIRLHRSRAREAYAAFLPERSPARPRMRLAADSAPTVRDPKAGRSAGAHRLGEAALEAVVFEDGAIAIYAEPAIALTLASIAAPLAERAIETAGYLELRLAAAPASVTVVLAHEDRRLEWTIALAL